MSLLGGTFFKKQGSNVAALKFLFLQCFDLSEFDLPSSEAGTENSASLPHGVLMLYAYGFFFFW